MVIDGASFNVVVEVLVQKMCLHVETLGNGPFSHTDGTRRWLHELKIEEVTYLRYQSIMGATLPVSSLSEQRRVPNATLKRGICGVHPNVMFFFPSTFFFCVTQLYICCNYVFYSLIHSLLPNFLDF